MIKMDNFQYFSINYMLWMCIRNASGETILIHIQNILFYGELVLINLKNTGLL